MSLSPLLVPHQESEDARKDEKENGKEAIILLLRANS